MNTMRHEDIGDNGMKSICKQKHNEGEREGGREEERMSNHHETVTPMSTPTLMDLFSSGSDL